MSVASLFWLTVQVAMFSLVGAGIFLLLRRRGPTAAAACAATVLMLTLPLLAISLSPWPRWEIAAKQHAPAIQLQPKDNLAPHNTTADDASAVEISATPAEDLRQESALAALWREANEVLQASQEPAENAVAAEPPAWRNWLPWVMATGVVIGLARLLIGIWAVRGYRGCSTPVDDEELLQLVQNIEQQLDAPKVLLTLRREESSGRDSALEQILSPKQSPAARVITAERDVYFGIEVRETPRLRSAATIGWRRPILLLPADWRTWTETERRVVIAHELAHVARRDYLMVVIARLATAIHFYQPLVLWLARQLRVQQELAADAWAADITGSRQTYLTTLAQMALRADEQTIPWPARAFLPRTGLLVKRVTWLKRNKTQEERRMKRRSCWILFVAMAAVAIVVAGIRGPNESASTAKAGESEAGKEPSLPQSPPFDAFDGDKLAQQSVEQNATPKDKLVVEGQLDFLTINNHRTTDYIPADAKAVIGICPNQFAKFPQIAKFFEFIDKQEFEEQFGLPLRELDDVVLVKMAEQRGMERMIFRAAKPHDWKKLLGTKLLPKPKSAEIAGKTYYLTEGTGEFVIPICAYFPDDRTIVLATEEEMKKILSGTDKKPEGQFKITLSTARAFVWCDMEFVRSSLKLDRLNSDPFAAALLPVFEKAKNITLMADISTQSVEPRESGWLLFVADCETEEAAREVAKIADAIRTLALKVTEMQEKHYSEMAKQTPEDKLHMVEVTATLWKIATQILKNARVDAGGRQASAESRFPLPPDTVTAILFPAIGAARETAMRSQSMNNLKQLALAMHNFQSAYKRFPAAAGTKGNSKHKHSWRVAILPFLEETDLYNQYHFDEPWDSELNKKLLDKMPAVFRDPHAAKDSTSSSYYMVTGKGTFGDSETGRRIRDITDGTSKTIMLVDAKRDIPWTKPEDIEIDPDPEKPLPKLGGHLQPEGLVVAAFADGSVQAIFEEPGSPWLRPLFTVAGGEAGPIPRAEPKAVEQRPPTGAANQPAKDAAAMTQRMNNAKEIMLVMQNYHAAKKTFPPAVSRDNNGKPLLSWRVALLPFIEGGRELHAQFHFDEPWDSEHNRKLIEKMPAVFRDPADDPKSNNASYFMVTGKGTVGDSEKGRRIRDVLDGTSKTIAIVESKRDIPWTKPEDIEIDPDAAKPLPKFGGHLQPEGRFVVGYCDGHVHVVEANVDPQSLREFFTVAGGEIGGGEPKLLQVAPKAAPNAEKPAAPAQGSNDDAAARQKANVINLKKIGLALHNFAEAEGHFPPPVIVGPDGKTKHSWRVAILPHIEGHQQKTKYRFDEPWDSQHNQQVLAEMPAAFRSPFDAADSRNASYFMATGKDTFGYTDEGRKVDLGRKVSEITDGMENTIMVVEAKRNVPWTKPEDIEIVPTQPLPKFGGFLPNGSFNASFASGHVRTLSSATDEKILKALFTIDGGEAVDLKTLNQK